MIEIGNRVWSRQATEPEKGLEGKQSKVKMGNRARLRWETEQDFLKTEQGQDLALFSKDLFLFPARSYCASCRDIILFPA